MDFQDQMTQTTDAMSGLAYAWLHRIAREHCNETRYENVSIHERHNLDCELAG